MDGTRQLAGCEHQSKWIEGRPLLAAMIAHAAASAAEDCHGLLEICRGEEDCHVSLQPRTDEIDDWLRLYSHHREVVAGVAGAFGGLASSILECNKQNMVALLVSDEHTAGGVDLSDNGLWHAAFERLEVRFFFRVAMPCWLMYGKTVAQLLAAVGRNGPDLWDSIDALVRLESLVVSHRRFARFINQEPRERRQRAELLGEALGRSPRSISVKQVKCLLAAFIWRISRLLGSPLSKRVIRQLFDAIARDRGRGLRDPDLPTPEGFDKAVQRNQSFWSLPAELDTKAREAVQAFEELLI